MASASGSDSNGSRDTRASRTNGITTEYISFADLATSSGSALSSAHTKENLRRLASTSSKHFELGPPSRKPSTESNSEANTMPHTVRHGRRPGNLSYLPPSQSQPLPLESRVSGTPAYSPHSSTRPPTLSHGPKHPTQPIASFDRVKAKKENGKVALAPQADTRHSRQSSHSSRSLNGAESPKWETDSKGAYGDRPSMAGPIAAASWDHMQREVEMLRKTVQEMNKTSRKQAKVS